MKVIKKCSVVVAILVGTSSIGCGRADTSVVEQENVQTQADLADYEARMNPPSANK